MDIPNLITCSVCEKPSVECDDIEGMCNSCCPVGGCSIHEED